MDTLALPFLTALAACLCTELEASPGGSPCFCGVIPGQAVVADYCTCKGGACGMGWVRAASIYPTNDFPQQDPAALCTAQLALTVELGVYRCLPTSGTNGTPPGEAAQAQAVITQMGDWWAMLQAVRCCTALDRTDVTLGAYTPRSQGGCGGGTLAATIRLTRAPR